MKILVLGHAKHGKDTFSEILRDLFGLIFISSSEFAAKNIIYPQVKDNFESLEHLIREKDNNRQLWFNLIKEYNTPDKLKLAKRILNVSSIYCGMRNIEEYDSCKAFFDLIFWVDASGRKVPKENKLSFDIKFNETEMILIRNDQGIEEMRKYVIRNFSEEIISRMSTGQKLATLIGSDSRFVRALLLRDEELQEFVKRRRIKLQQFT